MDDELDGRLDAIRARRELLQARQAQGLTTLFRERGELHGVHALADLVGENVTWCA